MSASDSCVVFLSLWSPLICLFQMLLPFPFLLPLCIPWTLPFGFVFCVVIQSVAVSALPAPLLIYLSSFVFSTFLAFCSLLLKTHLSWLLCIPLPFPISSSAFPSLPQMLLFFLGLKWMVFLRKSVADFCWARGPECHSSRLIYPPPLSSCYAWSLNFPFLLFFLCFCSQIPPLILPRPPPFSLIFHRSRLILSEHDTCSLHATGFPHFELFEMLKNMSCWLNTHGILCIINCEVTLWLHNNPHAKLVINVWLRAVKIIRNSSGGGWGRWNH